MKHAILILAHKDVAQLCRLVEFFSEDYAVFIHFDRKSPLSPEERGRLEAYPQVRAVFRRYAVHWGGFSLLRCMLFLLRRALRLAPEAACFHLLSGQDYPLKPLRAMLDFFGAEENRGLDFLSFTHLPAPNWENNTYERFKYFFFYDWLPRGRRADLFTRKAVAFQKRWGIRRPVPNRFDHLYGGSQWFSLSRRTCGELLRYTRRHPGYYRRLRFTFAPDETYIPTVVVNIVPHSRIRNRNYRYIRWRNENGSSPANLSEEHLYHLARSDAFFARKFDACSRRLMDLADRYLLSPSAPAPGETGAWQCRTLVPYRPDRALSNALVRFCRQEEIGELLEMGCGTGLNVATLRRAGIRATGFDANPHTPELSALLLTAGDEPCGVADLTDDWTEEEPFPLVLCIDTCGYIPAAFHGRVLRNLAALAGKFLLLSWAAPGRGADDGCPLYGRDGEGIRRELRALGMEPDVGLTNFFRRQTDRPFLREELYAFRRVAPARSPSGENE